MKLDVFFTEGFTDGPANITKLAPKGKAKKEFAFHRIYRRLKQVENICRDGRWLSLSHLQEPTHTRSEYPPRNFGAFLSDLDDRPDKDCVAFSDIPSLSEKDSEGYFTRYDAHLEGLHCAVLFTLVPAPRFVVFEIGDQGHISNQLKACRSMAVAKVLISEARALKK